MPWHLENQIFHTSDKSDNIFKIVALVLTELWTGGEEINPCNNICN